MHSVANYVCMYVIALLCFLPQLPFTCIGCVFLCLLLVRTDGNKLTGVVELMTTIRCSSLNILAPSVVGLPGCRVDFITHEV